MQELANEVQTLVVGDVGRGFLGSRLSIQILKP